MQVNLLNYTQFRLAFVMMLRGRLGTSFDCLVTPKDEHSKNRKQSDFKAIYRLAIYNDLTVERQ